MRDFTVNVFDEYINGTATTWYTSSAHNDLLGSADDLLIQAVPDQVSYTGTAATLTLAVEHSCNGLDWLAVAAAPFPTTPEINGVQITNETGMLGVRTMWMPPLLSFIRFRITLGGGTASACRLKVWVTGRVSRSA